jgi:diaminohydroxyphosphoribosylaminopyrimidine deaminase / 5-amino-6-(5-phosphoribosylamino)uracil reductase
MYFHQRRTGRPYVTLKMAQSLDGAIGKAAGERMQLTGTKAAAYVRALRYEHDAVMVGVETAIVDDPQLTVRPFRGRAVPYTRIVVDSTARLPSRSKLVKDRRRAVTVVAVGDRAPRERVVALRDAGVDIMECTTTVQGRIDLRDLLDRLGQRGMLGVLCEGGPTLGGALLAGGLVNELHLIAAPIVLGTASRAPVLQGVDTPVELEISAMRRLGDDVAVVAMPTAAGASR